MIPKFNQNDHVTQIDTDQVTKNLRLVGIAQAKTTNQTRALLRPELRKALDASWNRNESAYRYLGR